MSERSLVCLLLILVASVVGHGFGADGYGCAALLCDARTRHRRKIVKGSVLIRVSTTSTAVEFDCGELTIDAVREARAVLQFTVTNRRLRVSLPAGKRVREIEIDFHGTPKRGIRFFPDRQQVYTIFSTSQWMVCIDDPADKATLTLKLILPANLTPVANGNFISQRELPTTNVSPSGDSKPDSHLHLRFRGRSIQPREGETKETSSFDISRRITLQPKCAASFVTRLTCSTSSKIGRV